jgi:chitinase
MQTIGSRSLFAHSVICGQRVHHKRFGGSWARSLARALNCPSVLRGLKLLPLYAFLGLAFSRSAFAGSATLAWDASADPGVTGYFVYVGNTSGSYNTKLDVSNYTGVTVSNLLQGMTYYFAASAYDRYGYESSLSPEASVVIPDTTPPVISIASPPNAAVSGNLTIAASASDNVGVSSVMISAGGATLCTATVAPYSCPWNTTTVANGYYTVSATAKDLAGNTANASVNVSVNNIPDTTPPTANITTPLDGTVLQRNSTVMIAATASDNVGVTKVEFYVSGKLTCSATTTTNPYTCKWKSPAAPGKTYQLQAKAYDAAGNNGSSNIVMLKAQ